MGEGDQLALGVYLFLVRTSGFSRSPEAGRTAEQRSVRRVLTGSLSDESRRVSSSKLDQGRATIGLVRQYEVAVRLAHLRIFSRSAYMALRAGQGLCYGDLSTALRACTEMRHKVDITLLRRIKLDTSRKSEEGHSNAGLCGVGDKEEDPCDKEFATIVSRYLRPVPGTDYYIYWKGEAALSQELEIDPPLSVAAESGDEVEEGDRGKEEDEQARPLGGGEEEMVMAGATLGVGVAGAGTRPHELKVQSGRVPDGSRLPGEALG
ncbi:unnamed protein product, partial [Discosporangium mesarthrocarpum]